eukprot:5856144-Prymnesium_polylepis.1
MPQQSDVLRRVDGVRHLVVHLEDGVEERADVRHATRRRPVGRLRPHALARAPLARLRLRHLFHRHDPFVQDPLALRDKAVDGEVEGTRHPQQLFDGLLEDRLQERLVDNWCGVVDEALERARVAILAVVVRDLGTWCRPRLDARLVPE